MKKIITIATLIALTIPTIAQASFDDVTETHENHSAIEYLIESNGITDGDNFNPDQNITRAAFFKMLLANSGITSENEVENYFTDLEGDEWYAVYANKAYELGIIETENFYPSRTISKAEAVKVLIKWGGIAVPKYTSIEDWDVNYLDVSYENLYAPYIKKAIDIGLIEANDENYFGTHKQLTRAEAAQLIYDFDQYAITDAYLDIISSEVEQYLDIPMIMIIEDVYERLMNNYYGGGLDGETLIYDAIKGMTDSLGDVYTTFYPPTQADALTSTLSGNFKGIGVYLHQESNGDIVITDVIENSPAESSGFLANDIIKEIDGIEIEGMGLEEAAGLIRGEEGSSLDITVWRTDNNNVTRTTTITTTREDIDIKYVSAETLDENIVYFDIDSFGSSTDEEFDELLDEHITASTRGIILDVRNNGGGYVNTATGILRHFITEDDIITTISYNRANVIHISAGPAELQDYPVVVLVNENSASASEILAVSLQEYGIATVIGEQTFGKGTAQELITYYDGSILKMTTSHWLTPSWRDINEIGVTPDIVVENEDEQLQEAIDTILGN